MKNITIEDRSYSVTPLNPIEAVDWSTRVVAVVGPLLAAGGQGGLTMESVTKAFSSFQSDRAAQLLKEALKRCHTPQNESLADAATFDRWFREHPGDLMELGAIAVWELSKDFFPKRLLTGLQNSRAAPPA